MLWFLAREDAFVLGEFGGINFWSLSALDQGICGPVLRRFLVKLDFEKKRMFAVSKLKQVVIWRLATLILLVVSGCATATQPESPWPPVSEETRAELGIVGLCTAKFDEELVLVTPAKGAVAGAGRGAALGAAVTVGGGAKTGDPLGFALGIVLAPVGALVGSGTGAAMALPADVVTKAEHVIRDLLTAHDIQAEMGEEIRQNAQNEAGLGFVEVTEGPTSADDLSPCVTKPSQPVDTILETRVLTAGLRGPWSINPPLDMFITLRIRLIRTRDQQVLLDETLYYLGPAFEITKWVAQDAERLKNELDKGFGALSERVVDEVFLLHVPEVM